MKTKICKITKLSLAWNLFYIFILIVIPFAIFFSGNNREWQLLLPLSPFLFFSLYPIIIFLYYYKHDKNVRLDVFFENEKDQKFSFINYIVNGDVKQTFHYNDVVCKSKYSNIYIFASYYYIELRGQKPIIVSSLLTNLSNIFDGVGLKNKTIRTINLIPYEWKKNYE